MNALATFLQEPRLYLPVLAALFAYATTGFIVLVRLEMVEQNKTFRDVLRSYPDERMFYLRSTATMHLGILIWPYVRYRAYRLNATLAKQWTTLDQLEPGSLFWDKQGTWQMKTAYDHSGQGRMCIRLENGKTTYFPDPPNTAVRVITVRS